MSTENMDEAESNTNRSGVTKEESKPKAKRRFGFLNGQCKVPDDFDTMGAAEIEEMFYGKQD